MKQRKKLLESIAETISDYRAEEIATPTPEHVEEWINQFDKSVQVSMLAELDHVFKHTYMSKETVEEFLTNLVTSNKIAGDNPVAFWKDVCFLDIQGGGNSQREMLRMFNEVLEKECGLEIEDCGEEPEVYLYLDDAIFTGNRIKSDLDSWIQSEAPRKANMHVVTIAIHLGGQWYAKNKILESAKAAGKDIKITWWRCIEIEDRKAYIGSSDVLRPTVLPDDPPTQEYAHSLKYPPILRKPGNVGANNFFSSEDGRHLLEQEFLKAGVRIRSMCRHLNVYQRPLGNMVLETLGFGSMIITFRNCPNNCPLVFWAGDPWYPLFPRKTN